MAAPPKQLIENPDGEGAALRDGGDVLSMVLRVVRVTGSLQFCFMPTGDWHTDDTPTFTALGAGPPQLIPFHILVEGRCWLKMEGRTTHLEAGDVVAFPFGTGHQLGAGEGGRLILPTAGLPPKPWREVPILHHDGNGSPIRMLCGYLQCEAVSFRPFRDALPTLLHVRTAQDETALWLRATIAQLVAEVDRPRSGGLSMLERLTEVTFIELLRHQILAARPGSTGWLTALADPALGRCLALIHEEPHRDWSVPGLAAASGLSRSTLAERFATVLATSPMRYVRDWRLFLASSSLATSLKSIAAIAHEAGYGTEAAFSRAFARTFGMPPASWRESARSA